MPASTSSATISAARLIGAALATVLLVPASVAPGLAAAPAAPPPPPPAIVSKVVAYVPKTLECRAVFTAYSPSAGAAIVMRMRIRGVLPARWRVDIEEAGPEGTPFAAMRGAVMVFTDQGNQFYNPLTGRVEVVRPGREAAERPGVVGRMGFTFAELLLIDDPDRFDLVAMTPQTVEGRALIRYDFTFRRPPVVNDILVARESLWVDPRRGEPVRAQLYDPAGRAVGIIVFRDHRPVAPDLALPLTVEFFARPGTPRAATVRAAFQLREGKFFLPVRLDAYEGARPAFSLEYSGYILNRPLDLALFKL